METLAGFFSPFLVYVLITLLHLLLPGRNVNGYINKTGTDEKMKYKLNGIIVLFIVVILWIFFCISGLLEWNWFYLQRYNSLAGAVFLGIIFSIVMVFPYPKVRKNLLADFFFGRLENPRIFRGKADAKMWLYLIGAVMLEINILSFTAHHYLTFGNQASTGVFISAVLLSYFVVDYLTFEEVHLYTYDFFAERVGFKLGWGCLTFYPYFYSIPLWFTADKPSAGYSTTAMLIFILIFLAGWVLSRGANLQKYYFKKNPEKKFLGIQPVVITDGNKSLLVNGFWGLSRHINYLGEVLMATGIVLCTGYPDIWWLWLYPFYYVLLLTTRQADDDKRCASKYGGLWENYKKKVPYRIIPFIY
ncbi:MAG: DUF1295 domain-containing protein [Bacteroidales bacterium]